MKINQVLELDKFFERDIIEFLDEKVRATLGDEKGQSFDFIYEKIEESLKKNEAEPVITMLEEVTNKYNALSLQDTYKSIIYNELLELVELVSGYIDKGFKDPALEKIILQIKQLDDEKADELPEKIMAFQELKMERARKKIEEEEKTYKKQEELDKVKQQLEKNLFVNIRKKRLKEAIIDYKRLKELFEQYPSRFEEEKTSFYNDLLAFYMQIKRLKEEISEKYTQTNKKPEEEEETGPSIDTQKVRELMTDIKKDVDREDFISATNRLIELRHMASKIKNNQIREIFESKIRSVGQNIELARKAAEQKT